MHSQEGLQLHPVAVQAFRVAHQDYILLLSKPILTESGDMISEVLVLKGTEIVIASAAYNHCVLHYPHFGLVTRGFIVVIKTLGGENAHQFKPDRWFDCTLDQRKLLSIGIYLNLYTSLCPIPKYIHLHTIMTEWPSPLALVHALDGALHVIYLLCGNKEYC